MTGNLNQPLWFSRAALAEVDRRAVNDFGMTISALMENAGRVLADITRAYTHAESRIIVLAGPGNNGGDGLVAARHLANCGHTVDVLLLAPRNKFRNTAGEQLATITRMGITIDEPTGPLPVDEVLAAWLERSHVDDAIVDAIFGTGLTRPVTGDVAAIMDRINASNRRIISADIPSGLDCDSGLPLGTAVRATHTVSFCGMKIGFAQPTAISFTGQCSIGDIGVPRCLLAELAVEP